MTGGVIKVGLKRINLEERVFSDEALRGCGLVRALGEDAVKALLALGTGRRFTDAARLFLQGEPGDSLFWVLKGEARLWVTAGGDTLDVTLAGKGEVVGEREALGEGDLRSMSAQAVGDLEVVEFARPAVSMAVREVPCFEQYLKTLAETRRAAGAELAEFINRW